MDVLEKIDAMLARGVLDWTRKDQELWRRQAVAGTLKEDDRKYVEGLYGRLFHPIASPPILTGGTTPRGTYVPETPKFAIEIDSSMKFGLVAAACLATVAGVFAYLLAAPWFGVGAISILTFVGIMALMTSVAD